MYIASVVIYILLLFAVSHITSRKASDNAAFFTAGRNNSWWAVAFGMIGATISGISVVSVPGMVTAGGWSYLQTCIGFLFGYIAVAYILLSLYYKSGVTSIYQFLRDRFGREAHTTGAGMFVVAKMVSSATKLYIAVVVLQQFIFDRWNIPFALTATLCVAIIWLYTHRSGMRTIIWTDNLQTLFFLAAITIMMAETYQLLTANSGIDMGDVIHNPLSRTFIWSDFMSRNNFLKQFVSGIFIVVAMTGLDQDMMQKNLTCRTLKESQRNMMCYGFAFIPVNLILLIFGTCIILYGNATATPLPSAPDTIVPYMVANVLSPTAGIMFIISILSASFSSADSALTAITTTLAVDIFESEKRQNPERLRRLLHISVCVVFALLVILFGYTENRSIIDTIYTIVGYTYGPLLGLFAFGMTTKLQPCGKLLPAVAIVSPIICYGINWLTSTLWGYHFGYELLLLNGTLTYLLLWIISRKKE